MGDVAKQRPPRRRSQADLLRALRMRATWRPLHKMMAMQFLKESENMLAFVNLVNRAYDKRMARGSTVLIRTPERCR